MLFLLFRIFFLFLIRSVTSIKPHQPVRTSTDHMISTHAKKYKPEAKPTPPRIRNKKIIQMINWEDLTEENMRGDPVYEREPQSTPVREFQPTQFSTRHDQPTPVREFQPMLNQIQPRDQPTQSTSKTTAAQSITKWCEQIDVQLNSIVQEISSLRSDLQGVLQTPRREEENVGKIRWCENAHCKNRAQAFSNSCSKLCLLCRPCISAARHGQKANAKKNFCPICSTNVKQFRYFEN